MMSYIGTSEACNYDFIDEPRAPGEKYAILRAADIRKTFGKGVLATPVLHGITLELFAGELTLLMGPSGSGKTTLISILAGVLQPTSGEVVLCGKRITGLAQATLSQVRRRHVGFVFQQYNLFPALTAIDNVAEVLRLKGLSKTSAQAKAREVLTQVGLADRLNHLPSQLSGGQKQRIAIARALAGEPSIIFGDEVTGALDGATAVRILELLRSTVTSERGMLIVTHDQRLERFAHRIITLEDGRIVEDNRHEDRSVLKSGAKVK